MKARLNDQKLLSSVVGASRPSMICISAYLLPESAPVAECSALGPITASARIVGVDTGRPDPHLLP